MSICCGPHAARGPQVWHSCSIPLDSSSGSSAFRKAREWQVWKEHWLFCPQFHWPEPKARALQTNGRLGNRCICGARGERKWLWWTISTTPMDLSESQTSLVMFWFCFIFLTIFYLFFSNSSTMELSTTLFVMALLLSGKNLWFYKVLESFHCIKSDSC